MSMNILVETIHRGQTGNYAPHLDIENFTFTHILPNGTVEPWDAMPEPQVLRFCHGWTHFQDRYTGGYEPVLKYLKKLAPGVWQLAVETPYTD
jgi:hypothetical protein